MSERESTPKLKERSKLIKLKNKRNEITEEHLEENKSDITDTKKLNICCSHNYYTKTISLTKEAKIQECKISKIKVQRKISTHLEEQNLLPAEQKQ